MVVYLEKKKRHAETMSKMHVQEPCEYLDIEDIDKGGNYGRE